MALHRQDVEVESHLQDARRGNHAQIEASDQLATPQVVDALFPWTVHESGLRTSEQHHRLTRVARDQDGELGALVRHGGGLKSATPLGGDLERRVRRDDVAGPIAPARHTTEAGSFPARVPPLEHGFAREGGRVLAEIGSVRPVGAASAIGYPIPSPDRRPVHPHPRTRGIETLVRWTSSSAGEQAGVHGHPRILNSKRRSGGPAVHMQ